MENSSKKLVVYYSLEGNTKLIAENIAEEIGADILQLKPKNDIKSKGFMKYFSGGKKIIFKEKPELISYEINPEDYDVIFMGTPVWAGTYTPAFRTFFERTNLESKCIALFCCYAGSEGRTFREFKEALKDNNFISEMGFNDPLKHDTEENKEKAKQWAREIITNK